MMHKISLSLKKLWRQANQITLRQLIYELPPTAVGGAAAGILAALCILPLFVSLTFRMPEEYLADVIDIQYAGVLFTYVLGSYWFRCLMIMSFFTGLLAAFQLAKLYYLGKAETCSRRDWLRERLLPICLSLMLFWSILSAAFSNNPRLSFLGDDYRQEGVLTYVIYATVFAAAIQLNGKQMRFVAEVLAAVCACTGVLIITGGMGLFYVEEDLRACMFHQYNHYGYFLAVCLPLCFGLALQDEKLRLPVRLLRLGEFWLICNAVAFNSVRGTFLAICSMLLAWNVFILIFHRRRWMQLLILDVIFIVTIVYLNTGSTLLDRMGVLFGQIENAQQVITAPESGTQLNNPAVLDEIGSDRGILWRLGIQFAMDKPLFGHGPENLGQLYHAHREDLSDRPHNELLQFAASLGIPALVFYLTALGSLLRSFFRKAQALSIFELALFASLGGYLVSSLFGNTMYYTTPYFYMMLGFAWKTVHAR